MLERLGFSDAATAYLTGASGIDSLDEIRYLDGIDDIDTTIKGVTNPEDCDNGRRIFQGYFT
jgi:hypothetical protein